MKKILVLLIAVVSLAKGYASGKEKVITVSPRVGTVIDPLEKKIFHLFPYWKDEDFSSARFLEGKDGTIRLECKLKNGKKIRIPVTKEELGFIKQKIDPSPVKSNRTARSTEILL